MPLSCIINDSIQQGIFPSILKAGLEYELKNYRPISILPLLSKIFERCVYCRLVEFLSRTNILNNSQFGFRKNKSTTDALVNTNDCIYEQLNSRRHSVCISLDFSKAFDTVSHKILLRKLNKYGIRGVSHTWFESYLGNRVQRVRIGDRF